MAERKRKQTPIEIDFMTATDANNIFWLCAEFEIIFFVLSSVSPVSVCGVFVAFFLLSLSLTTTTVMANDDGDNVICHLFCFSARTLWPNIILFFSNWCHSVNVYASVCLYVSTALRRTLTDFSILIFFLLLRLSSSHLSHAIHLSFLYIKNTNNFFFRFLLFLSRLRCRIYCCCCCPFAIIFNYYKWKYVRQ